MTKAKPEPNKEAELQEQLMAAQAREQRALADYQNLVRRTREESIRKAKLATKDFVTDLIEPLEHLRLAAEQIKDPGLSMVLVQLWQVLDQHGLEKIEPVGKPFDPLTMEAVERKEQGATVVGVVREGYLLHGELIQPAKVLLD